MFSCSIYSTLVNSYFPVSPPFQIKADSFLPINVRRWLKPPSFPFAPDHESKAIDVVGNKGFYHSRSVAFFKVKDGSEIFVAPYSKVSDELLALTLLGTPMAIAFLQRGNIVLHGSCVEFKGKCFVFLGESGAGKSSIALAFIKCGGRLITDDVVVISSRNDGQFVVSPAYPWMKVDTQVAKSLSIDSSNLSLLTPEHRKLRYNLGREQFITDETIIDYIVFPSYGPETDLRLLKNNETLIHLAPHCHGPAPRIKFPTATKQHFMQTVGFIEKVKAYEFVRPARLTQLSFQPDFLLEQLSEDERL